MDRAWFQEPSRSRQQQKWFKHLGLGYGIRGTDIPIRLTKRMARLFTEAPDHYTVEQALRWGQIRGWGGDKPVVDAVVSTRLGRTFEHEAYWRKRSASWFATRKRSFPTSPPLSSTFTFTDIIFRQRSSHGRTSVACWRRLPMSRHRQLPTARGHRWPGHPSGSMGSLGRKTRPELDLDDLGTTDQHRIVGGRRAMRHCVASYATRCPSRKAPSGR